MTRFSNTDIDALCATAHAMADAARIETLRHFRAFDLGAENKLVGGFDPVTIADRAAEQVMRDILARERPEDGILGEEFGSRDGSTGLTWVLDPIDGTRGYISGTPTWGVLIGLRDETGPIYGIIDQPYIGERFEGGFGRARMTGPQGVKPLKARKTLTLGDAVIFTTFPEVGTLDDADRFRALAGQCKLTRYGIDCYAYALLAAGQIDLVMEAGLNPYDIQAPIAVIEAAGGIVTDWSGGPAHDGGRVIAAANADLHRAALAVIDGASA